MGTYIENQHIHGLAEHQFDKIMHELHKHTEILNLHTIKLNQMALSNAELAQGLTDVSAHVTKIGAETSATLQKVADLEAALANQGGISPEVEAAFNALKTQVQVVDDLIQDAPTPPTP